jgi:hypothetical protein
MGQTRRAVRPVELVDLPQVPAWLADADDVGQSIWLRLVVHDRHNCTASL